MTNLTTGLWHNNPALVQLLGLCPLLATTTSMLNGLTMGLCTTIVLLISAFLIALLRQKINPIIRLPAYMIIISSAVTAIEMLMKSYFYTSYLELGIFIPLIVTNCIIIGRSEAFFAKNKLKPALLDAFFMGLGFTWVLSLLGAIRELLAKGYIFAEVIKIQLLPDNFFMLAGLPVGAFLCFGLILAIKNRIDNHKDY